MISEFACGFASPFPNISHFLYPFGISPDESQIRPNELEMTDSSRQTPGKENGSQRGSGCRCSKAI